MKILFFIESLQSGGKERRLVELINGLSKANDIKMQLVLTKEEIHYKNIFLSNIKIHYTVRKGIKKDPRVFLSFFKIAKAFKPDIIHTWGNLVSIYAIPAKVLLRIPLINNQITNAPKKVSGSFFSHKLTFPFSNVVIANSHAGLKAYNAPLKKRKVIYNGFDFERISNLEKEESIREKFNIQTKFVVAMVASFTAKKDYRTFIKAANLILQNNENITFLCIGGGDCNVFKEMIKDDSKVLFLGKQNNVESIMNICDIGVLMTNSENHGEGIPNVLLEFMALAKPVIANSTGGTNELVIDNHTGYIIKDNDYLELKNKIERLLKDDQLKIIFGDNAKQIVVEKFEIKSMIQQFKNTYNSILEK